ncbi:hypothetical protein [Halococcus saccharolyticus]|uniref:hypothetical protein n=1 Tax=Halococcus saccharolyticus TaxID=62319 RepID=UPI0006778A51|nr:hypothetical protein [Halococcus saccharolyticus]
MGLLSKLTPTPPAIRVGPLPDGKWAVGGRGAFTGEFNDYWNAVEEAHNQKDTLRQMGKTRRVEIVVGDRFCSCDDPEIIKYVPENGRWHYRCANCYWKGADQ